MVLVPGLLGLLIDTWCILILILNITHTFQLRTYILDWINQKSLHLLWEEISTDGPIHFYYKLELSFIVKDNYSSPLSNPFKCCNAWNLSTVIPKKRIIFILGYRTPVVIFSQTNFYVHFHRHLNPVVSLLVICYMWGRRRFQEKHVCRFTDCSNLTLTVLKVDLNLIITNLRSRLLHKYPRQFPMRIGKLCHRTIIWRISNDMIMNCLLNNNMRFSLIVIR